MSGRSVVMTGGGQPLADAVAEAVVQADDVLTIGGADEEDLTAVADRLAESGADVETLRTDVRDEFDLERLMETATRRGDAGIDVVVPCARVGHVEAGTPVLESPYAAFDDDFRTNVRGVFATIKEALPHCSDRSRIVVPVDGEESAGGAFSVGEVAVAALVRTIADDESVRCACVNVGAIPLEDGDATAQADLVASVVNEFEDGLLDGRTFTGDDVPAEPTS